MEGKDWRVRGRGDGCKLGVREMRHYSVEALQGVSDNFRHNRAGAAAPQEIGEFLAEFDLWHFVK